MALDTLREPNIILQGEGGSGMRGMRGGPAVLAGLNVHVKHALLSLHFGVVFNRY